MSTKTKQFIIKLLSGLVIASLIGGSWWTSGSLPATAQEITPTPPAPEATSPEAQALTQLGAVISYNENGRANFISLSSPEQSIPSGPTLSGDAPKSEVARNFLATYGGVFGIRDQAQEFTLKAEKPGTGKGTDTFVRFQQVHQGIPILGGEMIVQVDDNNNIRSANGEMSPALTLATTPTIDSTTASQTALQAIAKWYAVDAAALIATQPELWVYDPSLIGPNKGPVELVWRLEVSSQEQPIRELVLVNAQRGNITLHFSEIDNADVARPSQSAGGAPLQAGVTFYVVAIGGSDSNDCLTPATACATINGAIGKAGNGDTIKVGVGTYTGSGNEVVLVNKSLTISGGWNATFDAQTGLSTVDGENARRGAVITVGRTATIERFVVRASASGFSFEGGGVLNGGVLTLVNSVIMANRALSRGAGLYNEGTAIIVASSVQDNLLDSLLQSQGAGIYNSGTLVLNNVSIGNNVVKSSYGQGGGIYSQSGTVTLNSVTISGNQSLDPIGRPSYGGGIHSNGGTLTLNGSIVAGNIGVSDCFSAAAVVSQGYNIIGNPTGCSFTPTIGDQINTDPGLGHLVGLPGYFALPDTSSAIDAGNPSGCFGSSGVFLTDQRGVSRDGQCDIGSYEYVPSGPAATIMVVGGAPQMAAPLATFNQQFQLAVLDVLGSPVANVSVSYVAPSSGPSGVFADSGIASTTAITAVDGVATAANFTANAEMGSYLLVANIEGTDLETYLDLENFAWFVKLDGNDISDCQTPASACQTINGAISKASGGDTIKVADGTYTGTGQQVVFANNKSVILSGGWDTGFTTQSGTSIIDGEATRIGIKIDYNGHATVDHFTIQNGGGGYGGISLPWNTSYLFLKYSNVLNNQGSSGAGLALVNGVAIVTDSTFTGNTVSVSGGAIYVNGGLLQIDNSTISGNHAGVNDNGNNPNSQGGGIYETNSRVILNNTTITNNSAESYGGGIMLAGSNLTIRNSIIARNVGTQGPDCYSASGTIVSEGYNLIGSSDSCNISASGDLIGSEIAPINPRLGILQDNGGVTLTHGLLGSSPAIDAGNPAIPGSGGNACLKTDQRGSARPSGINCDIGAFEGSTFGLTFLLLATYSSNSTSALPGNFLCGQLQSLCTNGINLDAEKAHLYARDTYNFYFTGFGRDSIDNNGMTIVSSVQYCPPSGQGSCPYPNAFWSGSQMVYGAGYSQADDVVAHELTHGVTQYESNLLYYYQSGAINESLSDVFGEFVDLTNGAGSDALTDRWKVGEDLSIGAIRNMADPTLFSDPDKMSSANYVKDASDNGGVHSNSGVNNKAAYLMTDGGIFNGKTVTALGIDKVARIYYEAQTNLLTSGADYLDLYNALSQACQNLAGTAGITVFDCVEVRDATSAVEMNLQPAVGFNTDAPMCATGQVPSNLFYDGLESGTANWTFAALSGVNRWQLDSPNSFFGTAAAYTGQHSLYADDRTPTASTSDSYAAMTNGVVLPANAYLHFAHNYGFEQSSNTFWDGGVLEYSTTGLNGTWLDANSLLDGTANPNNGYDGTLAAGNPLGARAAFGDDSHGYISSRYTLNSLTGQTIRFRWRMGTDVNVADAGWWLDDVRIYTCITDPNPATFADVPYDYWAHDYIESLWNNNFVAGCQTTPTRLYCPDTTLSRAEIAVFVVRGVHGATYTPTDPVSPPFTDVPLGQWYTKWVNQLKVDGYTAGCGNGNYCSLSGHNRAEASVFFMRMYKNNPAYDPTTDPNGPFGVGNVFTDMPANYFGTKWAEAAYYYNLIEPCETIPALKFCPTDPMTRAAAAYMMVQAKGLPLP